MSDLNHYFGGDLSQSSTGDLLKIDGTGEGVQRVLRRLLTNPALIDADGTTLIPGDYIFHPDYGAGLPRMIGDAVDIPKIKGLIQGQMFLEACVARSPAPVITVTEILGGVSVDIRYNDAQTGTPAALAFDVTK
ncbi:phage tail protein [Janthinobacterium agaricidamnosum]|uniref:Phage tail protein n=1 Tax=Janthinobacterium agaricidamnosum TaxID=55508 RepID=A0A3G2EAA6_9BURK|nr:phage tail protein [Janthinobacterium agaricidamnosum]AYM76893.1 phage tail protein [Janthinobacterium agaricidamnosum]